MADKLMFIPHDDAQNYPFSILQLVVETLNTQLNDLTNKNLLQSPKFLSQRPIKHYYKTFGTSVINSSFSPLSLFLDVLKLLM